MSDVKERLQTTATTCLESYDAWVNDSKDNAKRETLQDAIHEVRKVMSRLEIDMAVSERDSGGRPLPIPEHRSSPQGGDDDGQPNNNKGGQKRQRSRRPAQKKAASSD